MRHLPPLSELRAFEGAARHMSFKSAADELGVTPTAISHQIRLLEEYCGQPLFRRRPRPLALTESGSKLFSVVREGLDSFSIAISGVREGAEQRPLKVTATNAFAGRWLVPRLPDWNSCLEPSSWPPLGEVFHRGMGYFSDDQIDQHLPEPAASSRLNSSAISQRS